MDDPAARELLDERPELESALRSVLSVDDDRAEWTFDDVPVDSGVFGELVSRGVVERTGDGYRVADPEGVRAALDGEVEGGGAESDGAGGRGVLGGEEGIGGVSNGTLADRVTGIDRRVAGALGATLLVLVVARAHVYPSVFRDGAVVLSGNDPYAYRYWVDQGLAASGGSLDGSGFAAATGGVKAGEPLLVAVLWALSALLGDSAGWVMAWYPVAAGVVTGGLVYLLTVEVTRDRRVGLAALVLLAVTPGHAFRTSLGFADHHAFDYVWLLLTAYALVRLVAAGGDWRDGESVGFTLLLGTAMAGQILAWDAGALLLVPVGVYVAVRTLSDVRAGTSPLETHLPIVGGVALAAALVFLAHAGLGWHDTPATFAPTLLLVGIVGVLAAGELAVRLGVPVRALAALEAVGLVAGVFALRTGFPSFWAELSGGLGRLAAARDIAETVSLFSGGALGWLLLFGFTLVLAVPPLVWASWQAYRGESDWLVPVVYSWYFLGLSAFQARFAGQLAMFAAVFAGLGFVHLASAVDASRPPVPVLDDPAEVSLALPDRQTAVSVVILFVLVGGLGVVQTPIKNGQVTTDGDAYRAAAWMDGYADERGWTYPENYVFSRWGKNRMYNYFVSGQSKSFGFAQSNYNAFASSTDGERWYRRLQGEVNLIVLEDRGYETGSVHSRLYDAYGGHSDQGAGLSHYRALYATDGGARKVFTLVPGVRLTGPGTPNTVYTVSADVSIDGASFTYTREVRTDSTGIYSVRVPYATRYSVGGTRFDVPERAVREGRVLDRFDGEGEMYWSFDEGRGGTAYDRAGGYHGQVRNGSWVTGVSGTALRFDRARGTYVAAPPRRNSTETFTISAWIRPRTGSSGAILSTGKDGWSGRRTGLLFDHGMSGWNSDQIALYVGNGTASVVAGSPDLGLSYPATSYHHVAVVFERGEIRWYLDGERIGADTVAATRVSHDGEKPTYLGREFSGSGGRNYFNGTIDEVRYYGTALSDDAIAERYRRHAGEPGS